MLVLIITLVYDYRVITNGDAPMQTIKVKISPLLAAELEYSVENWLNDLAVANENKPAEVSFGRKVEVNSSNLELTLPEAAALYNELYNMEDKVLEWAYDEGIKWHAVHRSIMKHLKHLVDFGVKLDAHGWAILN